MLIGYARVSREDQKLELQIQALNDAKCEQIFSDKRSGAQRVRKGLDDTLSHLQTGDTLVVWKLDRLGRTVKQLVDLVEELESRQINFKSLKDNNKGTPPQAAGYSERPELTVLDHVVANHPLAPQAAGN